MPKEVYENKAQGVVVTKEMWRTMNEEECPKTNGIHFMQGGPTVPSKDTISVRQSCLERATEIVTMMPLSVQPTTDAVLAIAEVFENWILR